MTEVVQEWLCTAPYVGTGDESELDYFDLRKCAEAAGAPEPKEFALKYQERVKEGEYGMEAAVNTSEHLHEEHECDASEIAERFLKKLGSQYQDLLTPKNAAERRQKKFDILYETVL